MRMSLAKHLRACARGFALCSVTACLYCVWLAVGVVVSFSPGASRRWRGFVFRAWARAGARVAGMRINLRGVPPRGAFFLVANHLSYMDVVALASRLDCVFVAKSEVARWPVVGPLCRAVGTVFVDRRNRRSLPVVLDSVGRALAAGSGVVLFAEGTSTSGAGVAPFRPSLLELAARERIPVHYVSLSYRTPAGEAPASEAVCWWGDMTFPDHLYGLFQLPGFGVSLTFGEQPILEGDRKALARRLWSAVNAQFIPVV
jgi:1-acyl-sn-glycerol-3-phosphate acyltransferase